jgi:hypothetical protein
MSGQYDVILIKHLKRQSRKKYLDFLLKNGSETYHFYKYALKLSKCLFIYINKQDGDINGIAGFSEGIILFKSIDIPSSCFLHLRLTYSTNKDLYMNIINDITAYSLNKQKRHIFISDNTIYSNELIEKGYVSSSCYHISSGNCYSKHIRCKDDHVYTKDIIEDDTYMKIYHTY